jgi:hypothetical protein
VQLQLQHQQHITSKQYVTNGSKQCFSAGAHEGFVMCILIYWALLLLLLCIQLVNSYM